MNTRNKILAVILVLAIAVMGVAVYEDVRADGNFDIFDNLIIHGTTRHQSAVTMDSTLAVTGASTFTGATTLIGNLSDSGGVLTFADNVLIDGQADAVQLTVQGYTTQTANSLVVENSAGTDLVWITNNGDMELNGTTPYITLGDAGEEDTGVVFDGNAQDFNISLDDTADDLVIGLGTAAGTTDVIVVDGSQDVGLGGASAGSKLDVTGNVLVDGAADEVQLIVQGYTTQTSAINLFVVEKSDGTDTFKVGELGPLEVTNTISPAGAITIQGGVLFLTGTGATAYTLAAPTVTTHDGLTMKIIAKTGQAHTITATTIGFNEGDAAKDVCTLGGAIGDGITVTAYQGEWYITANVNCTLS